MHHLSSRWVNRSQHQQAAAAEASLSPGPSPFRDEVVKTGALSWAKHWRQVYLASPAQVSYARVATLCRLLRDDHATLCSSCCRTALAAAAHLLLSSKGPQQ